MEEEEPEWVEEWEDEDLEDWEDEIKVDCVYWGENVYPWLDDGCHLGHGWCDPKKCPDYVPKTPRHRK